MYGKKEEIDIQYDNTNKTDLLRWFCLFGKSVDLRQQDKNIGEVK